MLAYLFVLLAVVVRLLPHSLSFTPVGAALLFFGARMPRKRMWVPVALLAASDVLLNLVYYRYPLTPDLLVTWAWYAAIVLLGGVLRGELKPLRVAGAALTTSVSFFLVSNFAVWAAWEMYPKTLEGLTIAYIAAVPFFRNTLASDLFFSVVFFSTPVLLEAAARALRRSQPTIAA